MSVMHEVQDRADFRAQIQEAGSKLVVLYFHSTWCEKCQFIAPKVEGYAQETVDDVVFLKIDVDAHEQLAVNLYEIKVTPTFILQKLGERVGVFAGDGDKCQKMEVLKDLIDGLRK